MKINIKEKEALILTIFLMIAPFYGIVEIYVSNSQVHRCIGGSYKPENQRYPAKKNEIVDGGDKDTTFLTARGVPEYLNYINIQAKYDIIPQDIEILKGNLHYGDRKYLHRSDGKSIIIASDTINSHKHIVELLMYYNITNTSNIPHSYYMSVVSDNYINISIYEQNPSSYDFVLMNHSDNVSELIVNTTIPYINTRTVVIKIVMMSNVSFNVEIKAALLEANSVYMTIQYKFISKKQIEYYVHFWGLPESIKIYFINISYLWELKYVIPVGAIEWNYSDKSVVIRKETNITIVFEGYDYWLRDTNISVKLDIDCGGEKVGVDQLRVFYKIKSVEYNTINSTDYFFKRVIIVENPNTYDLIDVPVKIELNETNFNMLSLNADMTNIAFFDEAENGLERLSAYLYYTDGKRAIYYTKLKCLRAGEKRKIIVLYGNPYSPKIARNSTEPKMGIITKMSDLANENVWECSSGHISYIYYYPSINETELYVATQNRYGMVVFKGNISGVYRLNLTIEFQNQWLLNYNYSIGIKFLYIDEDTYYCIAISNKTGYQSPHLEYFYVNNSNRIELDSVDLQDAVNVYKLHIDITINYPANYISVIARIDGIGDIPLGPYEDVLDISKHFWTMCLFGWGVSLFGVSIYFWGQSEGRPPVAIPLGEEFLGENIIISEVVGETEWMKLDRESMAINSGSVIVVRIFDVMGNLVLNDSELVFDENYTFSITLKASLIHMVNEVSHPHLLEIWHGFKKIEMLINPRGVKSVVLGYGLYLMVDIFVNMKESRWVVLNISQPVVDIPINDDWYVMNSGVNKSIASIYLPITWLSYGSNDEMIYFESINYELESKHLIHILDAIFGGLYGLWENESTRMEEEISYIEDILGSIYIFENNVSRAIFRSNGNITDVEVLNSSGDVATYTVNKTLTDVINEISNYSIVEYCCKNLSRLLGHTSPTYLILDENSGMVELGLMDQTGSNVTVIFYIRDAQAEICSSSGYIYSNLMRATFSLMFLNTVYMNGSLFSEEILEKAMRLDLDLKFNHISIYVGNDSEISIHIDLDNMISTYVSAKYGSELRLDLLNLILIKNTEIIDLNGVKLECLFQPLFEALKVRLSNETAYDGTVEWIESQIIRRSIILLDYYSQTELDKPMLTVYLNDTIVMSSDDIYTLKGGLRLDIYDKWHVKVFNGTYYQSEINVMIKIGGLIIVNERDSLINVEIASIESKCMANYTIQPSGLISEMLSVGHPYKIIIRNSSSDIIFDEEVTLPSNTSFRPLIVIILRESGIIQQEQTQEQTTSQNVSFTNKPQYLESNIKIVVPTILIATVSIIIIGRLVRKYKKRKIVEMEKLIEKIVAEED